MHHAYHNLTTTHARTCMQEFENGPRRDGEDGPYIYLAPVTVYHIMIPGP
jgi:hypothetical protein